MEDKKVERQIVCPYRVEAMISNMDMLLQTLSRLMTKGGTYNPSDDEIQGAIDGLMLCDKNCAAWNGSYCARIFKGGKD